MANYNEIFAESINSALKTAGLVSEPYQKGMLFAEIAKAIALTGQVGQQNIQIAKAIALTDQVGQQNIQLAKEELSSVKKAAAKITESQEVAEELAPATEQVENIQNYIEEEDKIEDEWTDAMREKKAEQLEKLTEYMNEYDEDSLNAALEAFSTGQLKTLAEIRPANIDGFLIYLDQMINSEE